MKLIDYITLNHNGNRSAFGRAVGVSRQHVNDWLNKKYIIVDGVLYSPRRSLK